MVKVFDEAVRLTHGTAGPYGRATAVPVVAKASLLDYLLGFLPGARIIVINVLMVFNQNNSGQKMVISLILCINPSIQRSV
jgi:hypothetical protein